ncbi:MAG TPA: RraA family protein [Terriglobia bacterium]|nr:RraA family protein [Terriglobia bacterium]
MIQRRGARIFFGIVLVLSSSFFAIPAYGQLGMFSHQQLIEFTPDWHGARFADGRPDVPDSMLQRLQDVTAEQAWEVLQRAGYHNQFESGWTVVNPQKQRLVGRVVTAVFMPFRPDLDSVIRANGKKEGESVQGENSWIINRLQPGDVMVVDLFGKIKDGTIIGGNLATSVYTKTHNGIIVNGSIRDTAEIEEMKGFEVFCRGTDPSALRNVTLMGINVPIRMGQATVMPGDIAVSDPEGITFIPPQLAEQVADHAEMDHLVDDWGFMMLREKKYSPGQIDGRWTPQMIEEFNAYAAKRGSKLRMPVPK